VTILLEIRSLAVNIGALYVIQGISLTIGDRELLFLLGRNGAGKTTLLKTIAGLIRPTSGSITYNGVDITNKPPYFRARLGIRYAPDNRRLFQSLTVEENLAVSLMSEGVSGDSMRDRIEYIYTIFPDLKRLRKLRASQLSGGQQQMLNIGRAIASPNLKVLLIDEPTEGLSPIYASKIAKVLGDLVSENKSLSMVIVETKPSLMRKLGGRFVVINSGRIALEGSVDDILERPDLLSLYLGTKPA